MLLPLSNTPRDYAWGSTTAIAQLLGKTPSGAPEAELWLGAHAGSPAIIHDGADVPLDEWIAANPTRALAGEERLPFLLKVLAAAQPLSLQAHPSREQARAGFARENAMGVAIDSPLRNYKDAEHKPELIVALSDEFIALCGFRPISAGVHDLQGLVDATDASAAAARFVDELRDRSATGAAKAYAWAVEFLLRGGEGAATVVAQLSAAAQTERAAEVAPVTTATIRTLAASYPGDPGVIIGALLNRVVLERGEAIFLPAGNVHAYLHGLGIEVMSSSDNVLRGGLTAKHVDVDELLRIADFRPLLDPRLTPETLAPGLALFETPIDDFVLYRFTGSDESARMPVAAAAIALCVGDDVTISGAHSSVTLTKGQAIFVTGDETFLDIHGDGDVFIATNRG